MDAPRILSPPNGQLEGVISDIPRTRAAACDYCGCELRAGLCPRCTMRAAFLDEDEPAPDETPATVGDYELLEIIAHGGMGVVWRARQKRLRRIVALKLLRESCLPGEAPARRFRLEAEAVAALRHPHIVTVHEVGEMGGRYFFSMELLACSLADRLREGRIAPMPAVGLIVKIARGVQHAHDRGVLHRDLKPSNILLDEAGEPRVSDFGLARLTEHAEHPTLTGAILGTPAYMSPEQATGLQGELTTASDIYSLGAIFYEMLTGTLPFRAEAQLELLRCVAEEDPPLPSSLVPQLDRDLETICLKCLEKAPAARYPSALALAQDLERWQRGEPIHARPVYAIERMWKWSMRHKAKASLIVTALLALVTISALLIAFNTRLQREVRRTTAAERATTRRLADQHSASAARLADSGDSLRALPYLVENLTLLADDPAAVRLARLRFETIVRTSPMLQHLWLPDGTLRGVDHDEEFGRVAILSGKTAQVFDSATGAPITPPLVHPAVPDHGCLIRGISRLLCAHDYGWTLWDLTTGRALTTYPGSLFRIHTATNALIRNTTPSACFPAWGGSRVQPYSLLTGEAVGEPIDYGVNVGWAIAAPESKLYLIFTEDGRLHFCDDQTRQDIIEPILVGKNAILSGFSPNFDRIAIESNAPIGLRLIEIELATGRITGEGSSGNRVHLTHGWFGKPRNWVVLKRDDDGYTVRDAITDSPLAFLSHGAQGFGASAGGENKHFATAARNGSVRIWDNGGAPASSVLWAGGRPEHIAMSKSGGRFLSGSTEPAVRLWARRGDEGAAFSGEEGAPLAGAFFSAGRIVLCNTDGRIGRIDIATGARTGPDLACASPITHAAADARGRFALLCGSSAELWDLEKGSRIGEPIALSAAIRSPAISPDGRQIALLSAKGDCRAGPPASLAPIPVAADTSRIVFSPDGRTLLAVGAAESSQIWSLATRTAIATIPGASEGGAFSPDGRAIVLWGGLQRLGAMNARVFDAATGQPKFAPVAHSANLTFATFSPDSRHLLTASRDDTRLWDATPGQLIRALRENPLPAHACGFSPDGTLLWTRTHKELTVWETATGTFVAPPMPVRGSGTALWSPDARWLAGFDAKRGIRIWDTSPGDRPIPEMRALARLLSAHRLTPDGTLHPLTQPELREARSGAVPAP